VDSVFFFSSRRRHTRFSRDWSSDVCSSDLPAAPTTNVYDARLTAHEDGYVYAVFCAERRDPRAPTSDTSAAVAAAGILRSRDLRSEERRVGKGSRPRWSAQQSQGTDDKEDM